MLLVEFSQYTSEEFLECIISVFSSIHDVLSQVMLEIFFAEVLLAGVEQFERLDEQLARLFVDLVLELVGGQEVMQDGETVLAEFRVAD